MYSMLFFPLQLVPFFFSVMPCKNVAAARSILSAWYSISIFFYLCFNTLLNCWALSPLSMSNIDVRAFRYVGFRYGIKVWKERNYLVHIKIVQRWFVKYGERKKNRKNIMRSKKKRIFFLQNQCNLSAVEVSHFSFWYHLIWPIHSSKNFIEIH